MKVNATALYRSPGRIFAAADRGEMVLITRGRSEYVLTRKRAEGSLYGCLARTIKRDAGTIHVKWKALRASD